MPLTPHSRRMLCMVNENTQKRVKRQLHAKGVPREGFTLPSCSWREHPGPGTIAAMDAYFVQAFSKAAIIGNGRRLVATWVVCAASAEEAAQIIGGKNDQGVQGVSKAPAGTAEAYRLGQGQAKLTSSRARTWPV